MSTSKITTALLSVLLVTFVAGCTSEEASTAVVQQPANAEPETAPQETEEVQRDPEESSVSAAISPNSEFSDSFSPVANLAVSPVEAMFNGPDLFVNSMRHWSDASGTYSTKAELLEVKMKERRVRLLKENGVVVLVDYELLSEHDKNFVRQFIEHHRNQDVASSPKLVDAID